MTRMNENTPAPAATGNEGQNESAESSTITKTTRRRRRPVRHHVVNIDSVRRGEDDTYRALCGYTFARRWGIEAKTASNEEKSKWVRCSHCEQMKHYDLELVQSILKSLNEKGVDL